jgi:hypothetical protein
MVDTKGLQTKIAQSGLTRAAIADALQIEGASLYRKINNIGRGFTVKEMQQLVKMLRIPVEEASDIFFKV